LSVIKFCQNFKNN
jgi:chromosome segregation ATPase